MYVKNGEYSNDFSREIMWKVFENQMLYKQMQHVRLYHIYNN